MAVAKTLNGAKKTTKRNGKNDGDKLVGNIFLLEFTQMKSTKKQNVWLYKPASQQKL